jgi:quaternary ammonium compound-resistance protein SugE
MAWVMLIVAGLLEVVWAIALKRSDGLANVGLAVVGFVTAGASLGLLAMALRSLPVSTAYVLWTGIGAGGVALVGFLVLGEPASPVRIALIAVLFASIVGLQLTSS